VTLSRYRDVLRLPGITRLLVFAALARVPQAMAGIALTLHVVLTLDRGYAAAGLVGAAATVGQALGAPWRGRAVDRYGLRRALLPSVVVVIVVWGIAPFVGYGGLLVASVVGGVLGIPIFTVIRQSLAVLAPERLRRSAFALDSVGIEISYMIGPMLAVLVSTQVSTTAALLGIGAMMALSGIALMIFDPPTRSAAAEAPPVQGQGQGQGSVPRSGAARRQPWSRRLPVLARPSWFGSALIAVLGVTAGAAVVLAGTDVALVALLREQDAVQLLGVMFVCWCGGSMVGGVVYGALSRPVPSQVLLLGLAVLTPPVGLATSPVALGVLLAVAGGLCAPVIVATTEAVSRLVPEESRGEAMGWHGSSMTIGTALGAPVAGAVIDAFGAWAGFLGVGLVGGVLAALGLAAQRSREARGALVPGAVVPGQAAPAVPGALPDPTESVPEIVH